MWYPLEKRTILTGEPLAPGIVRVFTNIFPLDGTGWFKIRLTLSSALAAIVAPYADGFYRWIKGITVRTSRGEVLVNNVSGMALYRLNSYLNHSAPFHTPLLAAGNAQANAVLDIPFCFPFLNRPEDTIFYSGRYSNLELQIATGTLADLSVAGAVGFTAVTLNIEIISTLSALVDDGTGRPFALPYISTYPLIHADIQRFWDLESSMDLGLFGFFIYNHDAIAQPFCCLAAGNDHLTGVTFRDTVRTWLNNIDFRSFQEERQKLLPFNLYAAITATEIPTLELGMYPHLFVKSGSINEVYPSGKKSLIRLEFTNATGTDEADLCVFGMRTLR
jgi:hypothetical protein